MQVIDLSISIFNFMELFMHMRINLTFLGYLAEFRK